MEKRYLRKNPGLFCFIHLCIFILAFVFFCLYTYKNKFFLLLASVIFICALIISVIYSLFSWNLKIYFDQEEIYYFRKGQKFSWKWNEIISCEIKTRHLCLARGNPLAFYFEITSSDNGKKLILEFSSRREKFLLNVCPIENKKEIFRDSFQE